MAAGPAAWAALRARLTALLAEGSPERASVEPHLFPLAGARLHLPFKVCGIYRLLRRPAPRLQRRHHVPRPGERVAAQLAAHADRLQRPRLDGRGLRHGRPPALGPDQGPGRRAAPLRPAARFDFELELGAMVGAPSEGTGHGGRGRRHDLRLRAAQRLVGARHPDLGVPAARAVSGQGVRDLDLALDRHQGRARPVPHLAARRASVRSSPTSRAGPDAPTTSRSRSAWRPAGGRETVISRSNVRELYYSAAQQLAHHTSCGCPMSTGDLLGRERSRVRRRRAAAACSSSRGTARSRSRSTAAAPAPSSRTATG